MMTKTLEAKLTDFIAGDLAAMGYELVRVKLMSGGRYLTLQLMAERDDGKPMTVDDCVKISRMASAKLDTDDSIADHYTLEVSSPGIDRPLIRLKDFRRFAGHAVRIELEAPQDGRKRFQGNIARITGDEPDGEVELTTDTGAVRVPVSSIANAKLVMIDALLKGAKDDTKH